jgi:DNA-binding GntR family transcriptional regulator
MNITANLSDSDPERGLGSPARPLSLPEQIAERIGQAILAGALAPGARIREQELSDAFKVSRGTVREALRILDKDGVVRLSPQRGAHVTNLSTKEVNEIFEIREALHALVVRRLCDTPNATLLAELEVGVSELERLAELPDGIELYAAASRQLTLLLTRNAGNDRAHEMIQSLARQTLRYTQLGLSGPERRRQSAGKWRRMLTEMTAGNADATVAAMRELIRDSRQTAVGHLARVEAGARPTVPSKRVYRKPV